MNGTYRRPALCLILLLPLAGCVTAGKEKPKLTSEPSIERALDVLAGAAASEPLTGFLYRNPVRFEYSSTAGACHKFSLKNGLIFLPREFKDSDNLLALSLARAAYIYRLYVMTGMEEILAEEEETAALFQARIGLAIKLKNSDFERAKAAEELRSDFCTYIMEGSPAAVLSARTAALSTRPECQRPLETLQSQRIWLDETRAAINDESFFQLMKDRDLVKVRKGALTMNAAMKNDADLRALPTDAIYRYQRSFYDRQNGMFSLVSKLYRKALEDDAAWRAANQELIEQARREFSACNLPE